MVSEFVNRVIEYSAKADHYVSLMEYFRNSNELLQQFAVTAHEANYTQLQLLINGVIKQGGGNYIVAELYLLSIQGENLSEAFVTMYLNQCAQVFTENVDKAAIKYVAKEANLITNRIAMVGNKYNCSINTIRLLLKAVYVLRPSVNCLIPAQAHFLQACISAQMYSFATSVIEDTIILEVNVMHTGLSSNLVDALDNFNQVITVPSTSISEIVICALKKARLISLILSGQVYELPKLTSTIVSKFSKSDVSLYDNIGNLYINNDLVGLNLLIENSSEALHIDQNYGLAKQVVSSMNRNNVRKLTNTYITMSLNDISNRCIQSENNSGGMSYSKNLLIDMISKNEISAKIDEVSGLVKFGINNEEDNHKLLAFLERNMMETVSLTERLRSMQKTIFGSTQYISKNLPKSSSSSSTMDWEDDIHKAI